MRETMLGLWEFVWVAEAIVGWALVDLPVESRKKWRLCCGCMMLLGVVAYALSVPL